MSDGWFEAVKVYAIHQKQRIGRWLEDEPSAEEALPRGGGNKPPRKVVFLIVGGMVGGLVLSSIALGVLLVNIGDSRSASSLQEGPWDPSNSTSVQDNQDLLNSTSLVANETAASASPEDMEPTTSPTFALWNSPTLAPTVSLRPSHSSAPTTFTKVPTEAPSIPPAAKGSPVNLPTQPPTFLPTIRGSGPPMGSALTAPPTLAPFAGELTSMPFAPPPTYPPAVFPEVAESEIFRLRMYWEQGFYWQEKDRERYWCIECTKCSSLNFSDNGGGCEFVDQCEVGHQLWLHGCRKGYGHNFQAVTVGDFHQIKVAGTELCVGRYLKRYVTIQNCNLYNRNLLWQKIRADGGPFDLKPADGSRDPEPFCVTQQHHPKPYEILGVKECDLAHLWETGYWMTYPLWEGELPTERN